MTKLKICGLREVDHALVAADVGADFLGFVFVPGVRRQLATGAARRIIREYRRSRGDVGPRLVGLFANQPAEEVNRVVERCGLDLAQLCGDESQEYWERVSVPVIRQVKVSDEGTRAADVARVLHDVETVVRGGQTALLDRQEKGALGGTGRSFDWLIAKEVAKRHDFLLAGGLSPDNVGEAIALVKPWGVDVSSGVETEGTKDPEKIAVFAERVRQAARRALP